MADLMRIQDQQSAVVLAEPPLAVGRVSRRRVLLASFWAAIGALVAGGIGTVLNMVYPRDVSGFGGPVTVPAFAIPRPGDPPKIVVAGRFLLVNLKPGEGNAVGDGTRTTGGLIALYRKCPHLGCTVPWRNDATITRDPSRKGWFICPCHRSTYTKAGIVVDGPAPRSMDTMDVEVQKSGDIVVQTGSIAHGDIDNPMRAVPWPPA